MLFIESWWEMSSVSQLDDLQPQTLRSLSPSELPLNFKSLMDQIAAIV